MQISINEVNRLLAAAPTDHSHRARNLSEDTLSAAPSGSEAATVAISTSSQQLQSYRKLIGALPEVREDRVQALKAQVEAGTYHVSGQDIADLIIRRTLADNTAL